MDKNTIRQIVNKQLHKLTAIERKLLDRKLYTNFSLFFLKYCTNNGLNPEKISILSYMPLPDEPDIKGLFNTYNSTTIALPISLPNGELELRILGTTNKTGLFGITEPAADSKQINPANIDLAIVPGRAFTERGERIGRGKGYYDRLIPSLTCPVVALAYDLQILQELPTEPHDRIVSVIITESNIYTPKN